MNVSTVTKTTAWKDQRSGPGGCLAGNLVLDRIQSNGESFNRLKGTIFTSDERLVVGRVCTSESYLTGPWVHFCNIRKSYHKSLIEESNGKPIYYVFISVKDGSIHYWLVPHDVVGKILRKAKAKQSDAACIVRIREQDGKYDIMGHDITQYHQVMILNPQLSKRFKSAEKITSTKPTSIRVSDESTRAFVNLKYIDGREFEGVLHLK